LRQERELLFLGKFATDRINLPVELTSELPCLDALKPKFPPFGPRLSTLASRRLLYYITHFLTELTEFQNFTQYTIQLGVSVHFLSFFEKLLRNYFLIFAASD
jgi:hypothetical protein